MLTATLLAPHDSRQRLVQRVSKPVEVAHRRHIATFVPRAPPRRRRLDERVPALDLVMHVPHRGEVTADPSSQMSVTDVSLTGARHLGLFLIPEDDAANRARPDGILGGP